MEEAGARVHTTDEHTPNWDKEKPVSSVIATINSGSSYDGLFRELQEPPEEGLAVSLFQFSYSSLSIIQKCLTGQSIEGDPDAEVVRDFCNDVGRADPQSVVLNFECCSQASNSGFGEYTGTVMKITQLFLNRQHMVMFADFSLKGLIAKWDRSLLGPNPFRKEGPEICGQFELRFDPETLRQSPSSQLATVAELCDKGQATVHAQPGTIVFTVDRAAADTNRYKLEVLTEAVTKEHGRSAGHVLLRYPSTKAEGQEGLLLVSMGHWIELARLDVNMARIIEHATKVYGNEYATNLSVQLQSASPASQMAQMQSYAQTAVQKASPAKSKCYYS